MSEKKAAKLAVRGAKKAEQGPAPAKVITFRRAGSIPTAPITAKKATTDAEMKAQSDYETARTNIAKQMPGDKVSEMRYSVAFQRLVQLGLAPQVKAKYR
jgi:hypothetical protein